MSRRPATFRESDVRRAVHAVEATGREIAAVEISADGKIRIVVGKPGEQVSTINPWDEVLHDAAEQKRTA
jgi:hypothetical protein